MIRMVATAFVCAAVIGSASVAVGAGDLHLQLVQMLERQAKDVSSNAPDCTKVGDALLKHVDADVVLTKKLMDADKGKPAAQKQKEQAAFTKKYGARLKAAQTKMAPLRACRDNAKVKDWSRKLQAATAPR